MEKLLGKLPQIIREAARNPLGLIALIILILFLLIFSFFYDASVTVKLIVTLTIVIVAILIIVMIYKLEVIKLAPNAPVNKPASQQKPANPIVESALQIKVQIVVSQLGSSQPFPVQATTIEEDTYLLLSAKNNVKSAREHHERTIGRAIEYKPQKAGSVLVKEAPSLQFLAIVYDFDKECAWDEQWVSDAISNILEETKTRQLQSISLPMLGTFHGSMDKKHFCELLNKSIKKTQPTSLKKIWLIVPPLTKSEDLSSLQDVDFKFIH